ncbi:aryl-alcohol dehydrogenase [Flavobacterium araucananum]|nr:aryl-alcohol dehydrogenase [Flavobacterium araucananum]
MEITAAVVLEKGGDFILQKMQLETPRADEVLIKIVGTGTCHTDMAARDNILGVPNFPVILGHEGSGIVEEVGSSVTKVKKGDHVVLTFGHCGKCINCESGEPAYCEHFMGLNFTGSRLDGSHSHHGDSVDFNDNFFSQSSFATYSLANENNVVKVPKDAPLEILGPLGCGIQTGAGAIINSLGVSAGKSLIIAGAGAVGLAALLAAKVCSATTIVAIDINSDRLEFAKELGATHIINSRESDIAQELLKILPGGFDFGFDTTGRNEVINSILSGLRSHGSCGIVGVAKLPLELEMNSFVARGLQIKGIVEGDSVPDDFIPALVRLYQNGQFPFDKLIKTYSFEDINRAIEDSEKGITIKPVIKIGEYGR